MLFYLTCLYLLVFYYQPGGRIAALGAIRFEFLLGTAILVLIFVTRWNRIFSNERMTKAAFLFFVGMCLSFIGAFRTHTATDAFEILIQILKAFSIYLMIVATVDTEDKLEKYVWVYVACMVILIGEPFFLSLRGENLLAKEGGVIRLYGVGQFAHPNGLGAYAVITLPFLYLFFWHYRSHFIQAFLVGFGLICLRVIMLTGSRTAYVGLVIFIFCLFMYSKRRARFAVVTGLVVILAWTSVPKMYKNRFISLEKVTAAIDGEEQAAGSIGGRWELVQDAWAVFLKYPVFGCGMDSFRRVPLELKANKSTGQTHNLLMQVLAETGVVGLITFSFLLWTIWNTLVSTKRALSGFDKDTKYLHSLVEALQIVFLIKLILGLLAQHTLYSNVWWLLGGLAVATARITRELKAIPSLNAAPIESAALVSEAGNELSGSRVKGNFPYAN